jgi:drug/metabolite transporter (DMT)-like permease
MLQPPQTRMSAPHIPANPAAGPAYALLAALGFSLKAIFVKLAYAWHGVDAISLLALRMLFALPFFLALAWHSQAGGTRLTASDWLRIGWLGLTGYYLASILDFWGLAYISAGLERLILFTYPTLVVLIGAWLGRRRIARPDALALALSYSGIALAFASDLRLASDRGALLLGSALVFGSAVAYALYLLASGRTIARLGTRRTAAYAMLVSTALVLLHFVLAQPLSGLRQPLSIYGLAFAMAVFCTVLPSLFLAEAIKRCGAGKVALIGSAGPIITIYLGVVALGEPATGVQLVGAALVLGGVFLVSRPGPPKLA